MISCQAAQITGLSDFKVYLVIQMCIRFHAFRRFSWFHFFVLAVISVLLTAFLLHAAERLYFSYGLFEQSVSVSSLEAYAEDGTVNADLQFLFNFLGSDIEEELQKAFNTRYKLNPVTISQSFYDPIGETSLR